MKLHKLSNGNWIDLTKVASISRAERVQLGHDGRILPDRIVIRCDPDSVTNIQVIPCDDADQASLMMDELAALVNEACK